MNITFITDLRNLTYEHYPNQPKCMFERKLNAILATNPQLIKILGISSHPLITKCLYTKVDYEGNLEFYIKHFK